MRTLRLISIAASAEGLALRRQARRLALQAALGAVAAVFLLCALASAHVAGYFALLLIPLKSLYAALILLGIDIVIMAIFAIIASSRSSPDKIEIEARQVREQARQQIALTAATAGALSPLARILGLRRVSGLVIGALAARFLARTMSAGEKSEVRKV
jgi:hypothetical protein